MSSNLYKAWVYILKCADNSYYTGKSQAIETRIEQHQQGVFKGYTYSRRPVTLMWSAGFLTYKEAIMCERQIKGWSRAKKEALIRGDIDLLHNLAACRNKSHYKNKT
jgi:predicted GIY-YIG superfamily endonuclease